MAVLAAIGLATNVISAGASFVQANKQKKMMEEANAEAAKAMKEARKRLDVNVYDALTISDTPYERQREMANAQTQQMMTGFQELGVQGMRGATAALAQGQQMQAQIADAKTQRLEQLEQMQAAEEGRLRDINVQLDLQEAEGAQQAAADAQRLRNEAIEGGAKSLIGAVGTGAGMFELYKQNPEKGLAGIDDEELNKKVNIFNSLTGGVKSE
tara:strand:- start:3023 stop:3661 length:639 start_codon:yes stop_codon:yes gene_type:complete